MRRNLTGPGAFAKAVKVMNPIGLPDTLRMLFTEFDSVAWRTASESTILPDHRDSCNLLEINIPSI